MIIYNVTLHIDQSIHEKWKTWIKEHIPQVLATGKFKKATFTKVLTNTNDSGYTYSIQYQAHSREALEEYYQKYAENLRQEGQQLFGDKMLGFRTELEWIDEYTVS